MNFGDVQGILDRLNQNGTCVPFIVVMPNCETPGPRYGLRAFERELLKAIIPWTEKHYRVQPKQSARAIAGFSMGGFQSIAVGLEHLETFDSVGVFSAGLRKSFATESDLREFASDPTVSRSRLKLLYVRIGKRDFFLRDSRKLHSYLERLSVPHLYQEVEGGHEWPVWRGCLEDFAPRLFR